ALPPATLDFDAVYRRDFERFNTNAFVPGDHFWASFTHLNGYSSNYYTYVLDKVIALDFFAQFDPQNLLHGPAGMRYRQAVLEPGSTRPAALLPAVQQRRHRNVRPVVVDELELVRGTRAGCDRSRPRRGLHVLIRRARLLLGAHRHHGHRGEFRAHVVGDLLGGDGVAEEAETQPIPLAPVAAALDGIQGVGAEDGQRRHLVELGWLHRPLQLHRK